jgi:hypothetical protein
MHLKQVLPQELQPRVRDRQARVRATILLALARAWVEPHARATIHSVLAPAWAVQQFLAPRVPIPDQCPRDRSVLQVQVARVGQAERPDVRADPAGLAVPVVPGADSLVPVAVLAGLVVPVVPAVAQVVPVALAAGSIEPAERRADLVVLRVELRVAPAVPVGSPVAAVVRVGVARRPVRSAGRVDVPLVDASPSVPSGKSSTICRRRSWMAFGFRAAVAKSFACHADPA